VIRITGLSHRCLQVPDLSIPPGRAAVIGPNGGGKTTLLRLIAGIDLPSRGEILIDGLPPRSREVGWVGENPGETILFSRVRDELASPLRFRRDPCPLVDERVKAVSEGLGILHLLERQTGDLSAGEKVRVAVGAALVSAPDLLVLDEADSGLDGASAGEMEDRIGTSSCSHVVRATQRMELAARADHVIFLDGGRVVRAGSPAEVFAALSGTPFFPPSRRRP